MKRVILVVVLAALSAGCLGTGGLNGKVKRFNLTAVENRYAREGLFLVMQVAYVYRLATVLDLLVFNSWEFWSGTNPINGKGALVSIPMSEVEKIGFEDVDGAQVELVSDTEAKLHVDFSNGDHLAFDVLRQDEDYTVSYKGRVFFEGHIAPAELKETRK